MREDISIEIKKTLNSSKFGLTISEIAKIIKRNRNTIAKYLEIMEAKNEVSFRQIGVYRIWSTPESLAQTFKSSQEEFIYLLLGSIDKVLIIDEKKAYDIGKEIAHQMYHNLNQNFKGLKKFDEILDAIIVFIEMGDQLKVELISKEKNEAKLKLERPENLNDSKFNWLYYVEASIWENLIKLSGFKNYHVNCLELNPKFIIFRIYKDK